LDFEFTYFYPGLLLNLKLGYWFVGAGAVLPVVFYEGESHSVNLSPKFNFGFSAGPLVVTAYLIAWTEEHTDFMEFGFIGATIGYRF
jgi:hypothetical protein